MGFTFVDISPLRSGNWCWQTDLLPEPDVDLVLFAGSSDGKSGYLSDADASLEHVSTDVDIASQTLQLLSGILLSPLSPCPLDLQQMPVHGRGSEKCRLIKVWSYSHFSQTPLIVLTIQNIGENETSLAWKLFFLAVQGRDRFWVEEALYKSQKWMNEREDIVEITDMTLARHRNEIQWNRIKQNHLTVITPRLVITMLFWWFICTISVLLKFTCGSVATGVDLSKILGGQKDRW